MNPASVFQDKTLAFCILLPVFLLFPDIPLWAFSSSLLFWFYRLILDRSAWRIPSRYITGFFSIFFLIVTYFSYKTLLGREPSCAFLTVLLSLKILEYRNESEKGFLILLGLYLFTAKFLFDNAFIWFSIGFPAMIILIYFLLPDSFRKKNAKISGLYLIQSLLLAVPFGLFLFFYFPRFSSEMFMFHTKVERTGTVGFADNIQPGSVSSLIQNDDIAFRAEFFKMKPTINNLYWRGITLTQPDGMNWQRDPELEPNKIITNTISADAPQIQITLEPHYKQWLFSLDQTSGISSSQMRIYSNTLGVYKADTIVDKRIVYQLTAQQILTHPMHIPEKKIQITQKPSIEIQKLLLKLGKNAKSPEDIVNNISEFLISEQFKYTTETGDSNNLSLNDFLFKTKKGFCEHFSSSAALLLNYLKVPARVIVGYHGGEFNPFGKFWTVRQRDAHAWIEYADSKQMWHRFDPTAVIAPLRIALGAGVYDQVQNNLMDAAKFKQITEQNSHSSIIQRIQFFFEDLNYRWNFMFLKFDIDKQKELLQDLDINLGFAILIGMFFTIVISLSLSWLFRVRHKKMRSQLIYEIIQQALTSQNLEKLPNEAPLAWKERCIKAIPHKTAELTSLINCYIAEAFTEKKSKHNLIRAKQIARLLE